MGRAAFFTGGSVRGTGDIGGFTLLVKLWALERFPRIAERYIDGGDLPLDDSIPRGMRWLPIIERHQHRVAMRLEDIRYALDRSMDFVVSLLIFVSLLVRQLIFLLFLTIFVFLPYFPVDAVCRPGSRVCVTWRSRLAGRYAHVVHRLHCMAPPSLVSSSESHRTQSQQDMWRSYWRQISDRQFQIGGLNIVSLSATGARGIST
ncbi:hypothetical protein LINPERHAP1_LOCUS14822 [Linum perenne]